MSCSRARFWISLLLTAAFSFSAGNDGPLGAREASDHPHAEMLAIEHGELHLLLQHVGPERVATEGPALDEADHDVRFSDGVPLVVTARRFAERAAPHASANATAAGLRPVYTPLPILAAPDTGPDPPEPPRILRI